MKFLTNWEKPRPAPNSTYIELDVRRSAALMLPIKEDYNRQGMIWF